MASKAGVSLGFMNPGNWLVAGADIFAGISALNSANEMASLLEEQGSLTKDDYFRQASLVKEEGKRVRAKQTMEYVSSGVEMVGTPLLVLKETLSKSMAKAGALETTGKNYQNLYNRKADITKNEGMSTLTQ
jgi:hypothetical protein